MSELPDDPRTDTRPSADPVFVDPNRFRRAVPSGDSRERLVCGDCGHVHYENPKIIVGAVVTSGDKYLLCRRAIEPRRGYWTMPAGFMEVGESPEEGAARESREEANVDIAIDALLGVYSIAKIGQVHMIYRATLRVPGFSAGEESLEVREFSWEQIPWDDLAFPSVHWALRHHREAAGTTGFAPFGVPADFEA